MQRHTAKLEGRDASSAEWFKEIFQPFKERVHLRQGVEIFGDRLRHVVNDILRDSFVCNEDVNDSRLSDILHHASENAFFHCHISVEWHCRQ